MSNTVHYKCDWCDYEFYAEMPQTADRCPACSGEDIERMDEDESRDDVDYETRSLK